MTATLPEQCIPRRYIPRPDVADAVDVAAVLSDPIRAAIMRMLVDGPYCVCEMAAALGARENNVSNHLAKLREAGLVRSIRHQSNARFLYYERDEEALARARAAIGEVLG
jgi:ArsR family transcriptional regulator